MEKLTKQNKWICPNRCGNSRMLNRNVTLALCQNPKCNLVMMIPQDQNTMRKSPKKRLEKKLVICSECGSPETVLTIIQKENKAFKIPEIAVCYACLSGNKSQYIINKEIVTKITEEEHPDENSITTTR